MSDVSPPNDSVAPKPKATRAPRAPRKKAPPPPTMHLVAVVAMLTLVLDQALKYLVVQVLDLPTKQELDLIDPWLNLRMAWNQGVNFGLLSSNFDMMRWVLIGVAAVICIWVWVWLSRTSHTRFARISAGLLIGGAIGNVIDRMVYGAVADFLNMSLPNWRNPYSFNVADIAIFAGALGLFIWPPAAKPAKKPARKRAPAKPRAAADDKTRDEAAK